MLRLCTILMVAALVGLGGCAAADPTGGVFGESQELHARGPRCPAGELLTCELKSPQSGERRALRISLRAIEALLLPTGAADHGSGSADLALG